MREFREFIVPLPQGPKKILRHSREGGNPQFPRMREFNENTIQTGPPHSCTGLHQRHSREGGNPQFPRMREFNENTIQTGPPHSCTGLHQRHSREGGNDGVFFSGIGVVGRWNSRMRGNDVEVVLRGNEVFPDS